MSHPDAIRLLNQAYYEIERNNYQSAEEKLVQALRIDPFVPEVHSELAMLIGHGDIDKAIQHLAFAALISNKTVIWSNLSYWYLQKREAQKALTAFYILTLLNPDYKSIPSIFNELQRHDLLLRPYYEDCQKRAKYILNRLNSPEYAFPLQVDELDELLFPHNMPYLEKLPLREVSESEKRKSIFISFTSINVEVARRIAEILILNDYNVWLSEYNILNKKYFPLKIENGKVINDKNLNDATDEEIKRILHEALQNADKAICLINNKYAHSYWCKDVELKNIIKKFKKQTESVFIVKIPDEKIHDTSFPDLKQFKSFNWTGSYESLIISMHQAEFLSCSEFTSADRNFHSGISFLRIKEPNLFLDITGWKKIRVDPGLIQKYGSSQSAYTRKIGKVNLYFHQLTQILATEDSAPIWRRSDNSIDDISIFRRNLHDIEDYILKSKVEKNDIEVLGVHLFYLLGHSHLAFTYRLTYVIKILGIKLFKFPRIMRKYIISLPDKENKQEIEIAITTSVMKNKSVKQFLRYAPIFDNLVSTLNY